MMVEPEILLTRRLGHHVHRKAHELRNLDEAGVTEAPGISSSFLLLGQYSRGGEGWPSSAVIRFLEKSERIAAQIDKLFEALAHLEHYDYLIYRTVLETCFQGRVTFKRGDALVHHDQAKGEKYWLGGNSSPARTAHRKRNEGWDLLGILVAHPLALSYAVRLKAVNEDALRWAQKRGLVELQDLPE